MAHVRTPLGVGQLGLGEEHIAVSEFSFAVEGGAISTIALRGNTIPSGALILDTMIVVDTIPVSGGAATVAVSIESAGDVVAAALLGVTPWSTATAKHGAVTRATAPVRTTAARVPSVAVAVATLTAGRFRVVTWYVEMAA